MFPILLGFVFALLFMGAAVVAVYALLCDARVRGVLAGGLKLLLGLGLVGAFLVVSLKQSVINQAATQGAAAAAPVPTSEPQTIAVDSKLDAPFVSLPAGSERPNWVDAPSGLSSGTYHTVARSGLYVTEAECRRALGGKVRESVEQYIEEYLGGGAAQIADADFSYVERQALKGPLFVETVQASVGPMQQLHALLEFDNNVRSELARRWHQTLVADRLRQVGVTFVALLGLLATLFGYLKLDLATGGAHSFGLRWGMALAILVVVASALAVGGR